MVGRKGRKIGRNVVMKGNRRKEELRAGGKDVVDEESFIVVSFNLDFSFVCVGAEDVKGGEEVFSFSMGEGGGCEC